MNKLRKFYKGFTLIELLVVIAILGILTLLAMPRFKDHIENARVTNIKNDVKVAESIVMESLINDKNIPSISDDVINDEKLATLAKENKLYDIKGRVSEGNIESGEYIELDKSIFNTKLKGFFYANQGGKVYYEDIKSGNPSKPIDKSDLTDKKEEAEGLNPDDYEDFTDVEDAIEEADRVISDEDSTQKEIDDALKDLEDAIDNLEEKPVDKSELTDKIEEAENLNPDDFESGWDNVQDAIDNAENVVKDPDATQKEVDEALKDLEDAIEDLVKKTVNKDDLINKKEEAEDLDPDDYEDFTDVEDAINEAERVISDEDSTQKDVNDALKDLEDAIDNLEEKLVDTGNLMNPVEPRNHTAGEIPIYSAEEMAEIGINNDYPLSGKYVQMNNIDLNVYDNWEPIGSYDSKFSGSFDGNGYKITNLKINRPNMKSIGLFGATGGTTIKNVALEDVDINGNSYDNMWTGGLVGYSESTITNSYVTGVVAGGANAGGLVGWVDNSSTISNSYSTCAVESIGATGGLVGQVKGSSTVSNSYATGDVKGTGISTGGLVGSADANASTTIKNSYATGDVTGIIDVGGLMGTTYSSTTISNSYATGAVIDGSSLAGLVGKATGSTITNSYWDKDTTGQASSSGGGVGKTTTEMKQRNTYSGWDFDSIWAIDEGQSYPYHK
ncbi:MAG TPA: prepilin-type N-terminal cleavage/methylation domain-containing protein [Clostridiales bacterium]|nr:prepilin-type N-terminal cleavage/methylation domain-containing protein [Clostridiales bacterium]